MHLQPALLLLIFVYANLLNYVDRGLIAGVLPTYCVACQNLANSTGCMEHRSCEWIDGPNATCTFNQTVEPQYGIGGTFDIGETEQGILAGAFMGGYCLFSPIFAHLASVHPPFKLMSIGLGAWIISCMMASTAQVPTSHPNHSTMQRCVSGSRNASRSSLNLGYRVQGIGCRV